MEFEFRLARLSDIDEIMAIIEDARKLLATQNSGQWQDGYPSKELLIEDIENMRLHLVLEGDEDSNIAGLCAIIEHEDAYDHLIEGKWLTNYPYLVMHRLAVKESCRGKGYGRALLEYFEDIARIEGYRSIRVDTHENNLPMRGLIESEEFVYCGKALLHKNAERLAFEKVLSRLN